MCVALNVADPIWIPLTSSIDTFIHEQSAAATTWTVTHNLGEGNVILQVYNDANEMIIPDTVTPTDTTEIVITFGDATAGRAIIMFGDEIPANGIGVIDPQTGAILISELTNPNAFGTGESDWFGYSVAISGNACVISAVLEDDINGDDSGKAYIYNVTTGALLHTLDNPNPFGTSVNDWFGYSVAIDGNLCVIGAVLEDEAGELSSGKAYIYNVTTGALTHTLDNPNAYGTPNGDNFGHLVAVSGNNVVVSAYSEDDASGLLSGKVYIFDGTTGALTRTLNNPNVYGTSASDQFGISVSIDGDICIVGALEDESGSNASGKAYIFDVSTGALLHTIDNPNVVGIGGGDQFGLSVSISGNACVVGAPFEDEAGTGSGTVYIFNVSTGALIHTLDNPNAYGTPDNDNFGKLVSISGNRCIVSATGEDDAAGLASGKVYTFDVSTGILDHTIDNPNTFGTSTNDSFGKSISIDGATCIIGAPNESEPGEVEAGRAYLYTIV